MYLSPGNACLARDLISRLYSRPFDKSLVRGLAWDIRRLVGADYFSTRIWAGQVHPLYITNNPPEFIPVYESVAKEDFLMRPVVERHCEYVLQREMNRVVHEADKRHFIEAVQSVRPISDTIYIPIILGGVAVGVWSFARAGMIGDRVYSQNQLSIIRFLASFLTDALRRSLIPPPPEDDVAYLDQHGHVLAMGARIRDAFDSLFGRGLILASKPCHDDLRTLFRDRFRQFLVGPRCRVGMDRLTLHQRNASLTFQFAMMCPEGLPIRGEGMPCASVRLIDRTVLENSIRTVDRPSLSRAYRLTPREGEVVFEILKGRMNKEIARSLGVDESTIKRHTHNIYEKTGFRSRTELVLGLTATSA